MPHQFQSLKLPPRVERDSLSFFPNINVDWHLKFKGAVAQFSDQNDDVAFFWHENRECILERCPNQHFKDILFRKACFYAFVHSLVFGGVRSRGAQMNERFCS